MANVRTPADERREVGRRLRELRKRQGKTTMQIANALGTTQGNVEAYEAGRNTIRLESLRQWAEALGVEPHKLHEDLYPIEETQSFSDRLRAGAGRLIESMAVVDAQALVRAA